MLKASAAVSAAVSTVLAVASSPSIAQGTQQIVADDSIVVAGLRQVACRIFCTSVSETTT
jgi:hypothetical protein